MNDVRNLPQFPHRHNKDGTWDSICPYCYLTVACRDTEEQLKQDEAKHDCVELALVKQRAIREGVSE